MRTRAEAQHRAQQEVHARITLAMGMVLVLLSDSVYGRKMLARDDILVLSMSSHGPSARYACVQAREAAPAGVYFDPRSGRFGALAWRNGAPCQLGIFHTMREAQRAYTKEHAEVKQQKETLQTSMAQV